MQQAVVHVRCNAAGKIKRVKRDGRDTIVLPSYAAKANTVLNEILYPEDELKASFEGLNRTPAPLGHPMINNKFVPALDPEALARNYIFAWNENARWDGDRVALDVVIDEARAKESAEGRKVLNAIEKQEPISTSTGLLCNLTDPENDSHKAVARNIEWDHVAILLDEEPAISPDEGVGIFVNSASSEAEEIKIINSVLEDAERDIEWAADMAIRAVDRMERASLIERIVSTIKSVAMGDPDGGETSAQNRKEADMADDKQLDQLSEKVNAIEEQLKPENLAKSLGETIGNAVTEAIKPVTDHVASIDAANKAKDEAEKAELEAKVVKANILDEETAKATPLNTLRALAPKAEAGKAASLNGAFRKDGEPDDDWSDFSLNAGAKTQEAH